MSPEHDDYEEEEEEEEFDVDEEEPQSIFAATWFRALLLVIGIAVVAVLALPYVLEWLGPSPKPTVSVLRPSPAAPPTPPQPSARASPSPPMPPAVGAAQPPERPPAKAPPAAPKVSTPSRPPGKPAGTAPPQATQPTKPASRTGPTQVAKKAAPPAGKPAMTKGDYWVQVGAFTEPGNAARLVARLSGQEFAVQQVTVTRGDENGNEVFVPGASQSDVYDVVKTKGYRADAVKDGAAVRPLLSLRDAVEVSKQLAEAGMDVRIRRVGAGKQTLHLVRVGGVGDRKQAQALRKELAGKGIPGFVVKGAPR